MKLFIYILLIAVPLFVSASCKSVSGETGEMNTVYFLVAEINTNKNESYILPLTDHEDIADADSIVNGESRKQIVVAKIGKGNGNEVYLNRDLTSGEGRIWSWFVTEFDGFADATIEILDGSPSMVERDIDKWIELTDGYIGFWNYTVVRRVDLSEIRK